MADGEHDTQLGRRALLRRLVDGPAPQRLVIDKARCIAFSGPECGACAGLCPEDVDALRLRADKPILDADACTGCGACIEACVVMPSAIIWQDPTPAG
jgi:ferredoxin